MAEDPLARARQAIERALSAAPDAAASPHLREALDQIAQAISQLADAQKNLAIQQALLDDRLLRVERNRLFTAFQRIVSTGTAWARRAGLARERDDSAGYARWVAHETAALPSKEQALAASRKWAQRPLISVITSREPGSERAELLGQQIYDNWEIRAAIPKQGLDAAHALNAAAELATGDYLSFLPPTRILAPLALYCVAEALQHGDFDILYADEDSLDAERRIDPRFKPDWSPELLKSAMYMGDWITVRRDSFLRAGGFRGDAGDAVLHDLLLRLSDGPVRVHHLPRVLYHRTGPPAAPKSSGQAIARAVTRREKIEASCVPGPASGTWIVRRKRSVGEMTAIICSRSPETLQVCLASLRATASTVVKQILVVAHEENGDDPNLQAVIRGAGATAIPYRGVFDFAAMNNLGARSAAGPNLLFLNDDVKATEKDWADLLAEEISRQEVGIAGAVLWYPDGSIQHAGVVAGIGDGVGHAGRYSRGSKIWPWLLATREVSAVTGACLAIRKHLFEELGGFDTAFPNNYNDVDLCFRARAAGYRVICVPVAGLIHAECQSRPGVVRFLERYRFFERWADILRRPDPYYSLSLAPSEKIGLNLDEDLWYRGWLEPEV
jgi:O-antigen biosynthesis protein